MSKKTYLCRNGQTIEIYQHWYELPLDLVFLPMYLLIWFQPLQKLYRHRREVTFVLVGGLSTVVGLLSLWSCTTAGMHYLLSNVIALTASTVVWFVGNARWVFYDRKTNKWSIPKTVAVRTVIASANEGLMALFVSVAGMWYMAGSLLSTLLVFTASYAACNRWIWRARK